MNINTNYRKLKDSYLFSEIARKVSDYQKQNPDKKVLRLGIGDVTIPLCGAVTSAMREAVAEMGEKATFRGYGPEQGYGFLKEAIVRYYQQKHVYLDSDEVFVSDGAKSDLGNILDLFSADNTVLIPDPVYPVYVDTNIMGGRPVVYLDANEENGFLPMPDPSVQADIIYICSPNNPTGAVYTRDKLREWVEYALEKEAVILFDSAYECFVRDESLPRSIYEIPGAKKCAIEFCSFSKTAGFTGTRCGYTVVPFALRKDEASLNKMWLRRQTTKFNGVSYIVQRGAAAVFTREGQKEVGEAISFYAENARIISSALDELGLFYTGGVNSPYIWFECPNGMESWSFFDRLLTEAGVVGTPGAGFGKNGANFFRLTAFGARETTVEATERIKALLRK